jgi:hypothetical protein
MEAGKLNLRCGTELLIATQNGNCQSCAERMEKDRTARTQNPESIEMLRLV